jgi:7-cyano-7-deazaguanine synthase in queuosine biosynthesis
MKKLKKEEIISLLKKRKLEDFKKISIFEKMLIAERGYVFKMPKRGSNVILLLSGGLDSIVTWGILMKEYGLNVYPITLNRGEKRRKKELASIKFFNLLYKKLYPAHHRDFFSIDPGLSNIAIKIEDGIGVLTAETILNSFKNGEVDFNASLGVFTIFPFFARTYAMYLNSTKGLNIDTIFCGVVANDGEHISFQSLTSLRSIACNLCVPIKDYSWQFSSLCLEPEIGSFMRKSDLIKWGFKNNLPLEKTWSCYHAKKFQCGGADCVACGERKNSFINANVKDKSIYKSIYKSIDMQELNLKKIMKKISIKLKRIIKKLFRSS